MRKLLVMARTRIGYAAVGALLAVAVGGVATAAVIDSPATDEVSDVAPAPTEPVETTAVPEAPASTDAPAPVPADSPVVDTPAASVEDVTEPTPQAPVAETEIADPETVGAFGPDGNYTPAPAPNRIPAVQLPPAPKLPGEPGYIAPEN